MTTGGGGGATTTNATQPVVGGPSEGARQLSALLGLLDELATDETYQRLWFDFRYITDELVFYGVHAQSAHLVTPLANLCYKMLFRHEVFETFSGAARDAAGLGAGAQQPRQQRRLVALGAEGGRAPMPAKLLQWVKQLSYFLMHFPDVEGGIVPLRRLHKALTGHRSRRDPTGDASRLLPLQGAPGLSERDTVSP